MAKDSNIKQKITPLSKENSILKQNITFEEISLLEQNPPLEENQTFEENPDQLIVHTKEILS